MRVLLGWMSQLFDPRESGFDVVTMGLNGCDLPYDHALKGVHDLELAAGWRPDVVIWLFPEFFPPPPDLESLGAPIVAVYGDWNLGFNADRANFDRFSYVFTDRLGVYVFQRYGHAHVEEWLTYSVFAHRHPHWPDEPRIHDVTFAGNLRGAVQGERNQWLRRLAKLSDRYDVVIGSGVLGDDYTRLINQSKIVFNRTIRNELNMRCYEALAVKALLFVEEENVEAPDFLEDRVHCVYYNDENFESLLVHYLDHPEEREAIAEAGHRRWQEMTYRTTWPRLLERVATLWREGRLNPGRPSLAAIAQYYFNTRLADPLTQAQRLGEQALKAGERNEAIKLLTLLVMEDVERFEDPEQAKQAEAACRAWLDESSGDPVARYHLAGALRVQGRILEAEAVLERLNDDLQKDRLSRALEQADWVRCAFEALRTAWERVSFLAMGDRRVLAEGRCNLLRAAVLTKLGRLVVDRDPEKAVDYFAQSLELWPSQPDVRVALADLYWARLKMDDAIRHLEAAFHEMPFQLEDGCRLASWLMQAERYREALHYCQELLSLCKAAPHLTEHQSSIMKLKETILDMQYLQANRHA